MQSGTQLPPPFEAIYLEKNKKGTTAVRIDNEGDFGEQVCANKANLPAVLQVKATIYLEPTPNGIVPTVAQLDCQSALPPNVVQDRDNHLVNNNKKASPVTSSGPPKG